MKFIKTFLSIIFSILFIITLTTSIFVFSIKSFISKENVTKIVNETDITSFIDYDVTNNPEINEKYLEIPEVKELADNLINQTIDYIINDQGIPQITEEDINKIINSNYYKEKLGITLTEEEKTKYISELKEIYETTNETIQNELSTIKNDLHENEYIKIILYPNFIPICIIILITLTVLIGICRWSWYRPLSWIGISTIIAGGLNILFNQIIKTNLLKEITDKIANIITNDLIKAWLNNSTIVLIIGFVLLFSYFIINKLNNKEKHIN